MKRIISSLFIVLFSLAAASFAAEITLSENFSGYATVADMEANGWDVNVYNHRSQTPYYNYSLSTNSFAITEMYYGTEDFKYGTGRILLQADYRLPAAIDGDFSLSMDLSWLAPSNANKQEMWLMFLSPNGGHITGAQYHDSSATSQGLLYSRFYNLGSTPATYTENATNWGVATGNGAATMSIIRENGILTVRTELTSANGSPVGSNPPAAQVSTSTYASQNFQIITIFFDAYEGSTMGDMFVHNVEFTGESSTYQPPIAVPEPASVILLGLACASNFVRKLSGKR
ncbi:MAG: PEP-CTERM sorting domain-containing protein [Candidatus Auribacterota bacterium]